MAFILSFEDPQLDLPQEFCRETFKEEDEYFDCFLMDPRFETQSLFSLLEIELNLELFLYLWKIFCLTFVGDCFFK